MRDVIFTQAARAELIEAQDWYESQASGLGRRFRSEIDTAVRRIADNPQQFPVMFRALRRARIRKFPYGLFFTLTDDAAIVIACFHSSRDPQQWHRRA